MNRTALTSADAAHANAKRESDRLRRLIESGKDTQADVASYQTQLAARATATSLQQATLSALFDTATASLSAGQRSAMQRIDAAKGWGLPAEFAVVERSEAAWVVRCNETPPALT